MSTVGDMVVSGLEVRPHEHMLLVHGREVSLTSREFEIVTRLAEHPGWVFSADQLSDEAEEADYSPESVSVHVSRLRHKLSAAGAPDVVETVRGFGYRLRSTSDGAHADESAEPVGATRVLRDADWQLHEAVLEIGHSGSAEQQQSAADALEQARRSIYSILAE